MNTPARFSIRSVVTLVLTVSFLGLAVSGVCLYAAPQCSVARQTGWTMLGLAKDQWASLHMVTALSSLLLAFVHLLVYNWKPFTGYFKRKRDQRRLVRPEVVAAAVAGALILVGGALAFPPFHLLPAGHDAIQAYHREQADLEESDRGVGGGRGAGHAWTLDAPASLDGARAEKPEDALATGFRGSRE